MGLRFSWFFALVVCLSGTHLHAKPIPGEYLFDSPSAFAFQLSPNTEYIAGILRNSQGPYLSLVKTESLSSYRLFSYKRYAMKNILSFIWLDNDSLFVQYQSEEFAHAAVIDIVFDANGDPEDYEFNPVAYNGVLVDALPYEDDTVLYFVREQSKRLKPGVYKVSTKRLARKKIKKKSLIQAEIPGVLMFATGRNHQIRLAVVNKDDSTRILFKLPSGEWEEIYELVDPSMSFIPVGVLENGQIAVMSNEAYGNTALLSFDPATKSYTDTLYNENGRNLVNAQLNEAGTGLRFVSYFDRGVLVTEYFSSKNARHFQLLEKAFPGKQVLLVSERAGSPIKVVFVSSSEDAGAYLIFNTDTLETRYLTVAFPKLEDELLQPSIIETIKVDDGFEFSSVTTQPFLHAGNETLLVFLQAGLDGPYNHGGFDRLAQFYVSRGYTVSQVNYTSDPGSGGIYGQRRGVLGRVIERDPIQLVRHLKKKYKLKNVCIVGSSYAAYASISTAQKYGGDIDCAVGMFGVYDLNEFFSREDNLVGLEYSKWMSSRVSTDEISLDELSPINHVARTQKPLLLIGGEKDEVLKFTQTENMVDALRDRKINVEKIYYVNAGHGQQYWGGDRHQYTAIEEFVRRTLELPAPELQARDVLAQEYNWLGLSYFFGGLVAKDYPKAYQIFNSSAQMGSAQAGYSIGYVFENGHGVVKSAGKAIDWYVLASSGGVGLANCRLGMIYAEGAESIDKDVHQAKEYFKKGIDENLILCITGMAGLIVEEEGLDGYVDVFELLKKVPDDKSFDSQVFPVIEKLYDLSVENEDVMSLIDEYLLSRFQAFYYRGLIEFETPGSFRFDGKYSYIRQTTNINGFEERFFGISLRREKFNAPKIGNMVVLNGNDNIVLKLTWTKLNEKGKPSDTIIEKLVFLKNSDPAFAIFSLGDDWKQYIGEWNMELFSLEGERVFLKKFHVE